jgi:hypothetical protein
VTECREVWTLVASKVASLQEIDQHWTVDDVLDACDALAEFGDVATWLRPRPPKPPPQPRRQGFGP